MPTLFVLQTQLSSPPSAPLASEWVNPTDEPSWDELVLQHADCSVFHSSGWAKVLSATYGHDPVYLLNRREGSLHTVFPIMEVNSRLTGRRGVSLPFTDLCDPLMCANGEFAGVFQQAASFGTQRKWNYLECRIGSEEVGLQQPSLEFFGHCIDLDRSEEAIFAGFNSTLRNEIRKTERAGVEVVFARDLAAVKAYYRLHCLTRKKHGLPPQPFCFFRSIHEHLLSRGAGFVAFAFLGKHGGTEKESKKGSSDRSHGRAPQVCASSIEVSQDRLPIAAAIFLNFGKRAFYKFSASDESEKRLPGGKLAMWRAIQWYKDRGLKAIELGRTSIENNGLRRYKQTWGARERRIRYFKYDLRRGRFLTDRDKVYGWYNRFFNICPRWLSRCFGSLLYRHLD